MIRPAVESDLPRLIEMGRAFFGESGFSAETEFDPVSTLATFEELMANEDGALLVGESQGRIAGMAAALAYPFYFNAGHKTGQELFWWVEPDKRGGTLGVRLLQALEQWAAGRGCKTLSMVALPSIAGPAERIYARMGYRPSERSYLKVV